MTSMEVPRAIKKRKLMDKTLPNVILEDEEFSVDSKMYQDLLDMEKRLDWTMTRKRVEVQDALGRPVTTTRTLRLFLSHTVSGQEWQKGEGAGDDVNFDTGDGIPAWQLKIEGRLLEVPHQRKDKASPRKFSAFIKHMIVEMDRDPALYPDGNIVEWARAPNQDALDGFTVRRTGDKPVKIRILIYIEHQPEQHKIKPELASALGIKEDSRTGVMQAIWNYIKVKNLQDKSNRKLIKLDEYLSPAFGGREMISFEELSVEIPKLLTAPDPIILHYTINPSLIPPERASAYDVEVKMDDSNLKARMNNVVVNMSPESSRELAKLDEEIALHVQSLHNAHIKRTFLRSFASGPAEFVQTWLASQSRDLESILGSGPSEGATVRQEELKRSEFFRLPWVEEAVAVQEGMRLASRLAVMP
ncbi:SWI/SNF complex protein [Neolentinus lepideus HHB14362 ss-1]|uniref:SWI/SNF complex protein n=1 Tax=Neolentinus lepideus HHB14362 ss-1 TaxID=1314782 RepID=A0A165SF61_9AGAM|nr:SWI/SNF complex protein [Neolentinus lepideus HHB14362 ss-1]